MPKLIRITTVPVSLQKLLTNQMRFMRQNGFDVIMMSADGQERDSLMEQQGCPHIIIPMTRQITPFQDLYCLLLLVYYFIKIKPDIVHTHTPKAGLLGMLAAFITRVPVRLHTVAGLPLMVAQGFKKRLLVFIEKLTYSSATLVFANSKSIKEYIIDNEFCPASKLDLISEGSSNGIEIKEFERSSLQKPQLEAVKKQINFDPNNIYLVSVGRMVNDKGITELVNAFEKLTPQYKGRLKLILVGPSEDGLDPLPAATFQKINNNTDIFAVGYSDKVAYFMSLATVLVHPSHREGFPNVLLQAGIMKCPILCSKIHGNIDVIENDQEGTLFEVKNEDSLLLALNYALENPLDIQKKAENLYRKITQFFDRPLIQFAIKEKYNTLLSNPTPVVNQQNEEDYRFSQSLKNQ